ncbi:MAG: lipase family protein [Gammaproteobacteria bacterium]
MSEKSRILRRAYQLAEASRLIYESPDIIRARILGERKFDGCSGFRNFRFIDSPRAKVFICADETDLLMVFRGMEFNSLEEVLADLDCRFWRNPLGGMTHEGFSDALDRVFPEINRVREEFSPSGRNIWITGHSLGGALAALAAAELAYWFPKLSIGIYTFGQPRVGDLTFCRAFNRIFRGRCFRFVNNNDGVPGLIRLGWLLNYRDIGQEVYIDSAGTPHFQFPFLNRWIEKTEGFVGRFGNGDPDALHECGIDHYAGLLAGATEQT